DCPVSPPTLWDELPDDLAQLLLPTVPFFFLVLRPAPSSTLFPYTTLFRSDAGHGGQVLVSQGTAELLQPEVPPDTHLHFLGTHRSEEHTSELQSRFDLVCRLLLEKKKHTLPGRLPPDRCDLRGLGDYRSLR